MTFEEILDGISYRLAGNCDPSFLKRPVSSIATRVKDVDGGALFVCVRTALGDGHDVAVAAYGAGSRLFVARHALPLPTDATVVVVNEPEAWLGELAARLYAYPARELTVLGVVGAVGKTSVVEMTAGILRRAGRRVATLTTDGERIGDSFVPAGSVVTDAVGIQDFLRRSVHAGAEIALLELSSYMLAQGVAVGIPFTALSLTGAKEKELSDASVCDFLKSAAPPFLVLPDGLAELVQAPCGRRVLLGEGGWLYAADRQPYVSEGGLGTRFTLCTAEGEGVSVSLPVAGDLAIDNALHAAALACIAGCTVAESAAGLAAVVPRGRMECIAADHGRYVLLDSAYEAQSLGRVLRALRPYTRGRLGVLLGSVGGRARLRRAPLGEAAALYADAIYLTADDPADEDPVQICRDMEAGVRATGRNVRCAIIPSRAEAIRRAVCEMRPGDVLLLAGKGGQQTQLLRGERVLFSERELVRRALDRSK